MLQAETLRFLKNLKKNNSREWFEKNRKAYEAARDDFSELVNQVIGQFGKKDPTLVSLTARDCLFRINRDIRFSKDKSPYKTNMGASMINGGKKSLLAGYYFHLEPGGKSFCGGGRYMAAPEEMRKIRQEIDYNWKEFERIIKSKKFTSVYGNLEKDGFSLSREPKGYEKNNPAIEYIRLKSWIALAPVTDADLTTKGLVQKITNSFEALQPLIIFLNRALDAHE